MTGEGAPAPKPVVFLTGPGGAGKSTLGSWLWEDLGYLFLELDLFCLDGVDFHGLRKAWDPFWNGFDAAPVAALLRAQASRSAGVALSFPSYTVFTPRHLAALRAAAVETVVLWGPERRCVEAFVAREIRSGRRLSGAYWRKFNQPVLEAYGAPEYASCRIEVFAPDGAFRTRGELVGEIGRRAAARPAPPTSSGGAR